MTLYPASVGVRWGHNTGVTPIAAQGLRLKNNQWKSSECLVGSGFDDAADGSRLLTDSWLAGNIPRS
jgi:hypothetical protein